MLGNWGNLERVEIGNVPERGHIRRVAELIAEETGRGRDTDVDWDSSGAHGGKIKNRLTIEEMERRMILDHAFDGHLSRARFYPSMYSDSMPYWEDWAIYKWCEPKDLPVKQKVELNGRKFKGGEFQYRAPRNVGGIRSIA